MAEQTPIKNPRSGHSATWWKNRIDYLNRKVCRNNKELQEVIDDILEASVGYFRASIVSMIVREFSKLVEQTPVDVGRARAGWVIDSAPTDYAPPSIKRKPKKDGEGNTVKDEKGKPVYEKEILPEFAERIRKNMPDEMKTAQLSQADVIYIINNVEYILALEAGWSVQPPKGFIGLFLKRVRSELNNLAAKL